MFEHGLGGRSRTARSAISSRIVLFWVFTYYRERSFRIARSDFWLVGLAAPSIFGNQFCFVYTSSSRTRRRSRFPRTTPIFIGPDLARAPAEHLARPFWIGALGHVRRWPGLIAAANGVSARASTGTLLGIATALNLGRLLGDDCAADAPLLRRSGSVRSCSRSGGCRWRSSASSRSATSSSKFSGEGLLRLRLFSGRPLFLIQRPWFTAIDRVGASRAVALCELQPFFAVVFALILLSESLDLPGDRRAEF